MASLPNSAEVTVPELWVAVASTPRTRDTVNYKHLVHSVGGALYGRDGARLHWCPTEYPDGIYDPVSWELVEYRGWTPDWIGSIVSHLECMSAVHNLYEFENCILDRVMAPDGGLFNAQYLADGINGDLYPTIHCGASRGRHLIHGVNELGGSYLIIGIKEMT